MLFETAFQMSRVTFCRKKTIDKIYKIVNFFDFKWKINGKVVRSELYLSGGKFWVPEKCEIVDSELAKFGQKIYIPRK